MEEIAEMSMDYWYRMILENNSDYVPQMINCLYTEPPQMCSVTFERHCNMQCRHCIYRSEQSSARVSRDADLHNRVLNIVSQLPSETPSLLHEGRIVLPWHLLVLSSAKAIRPELRLGLIDNGSYVRHISCFKGLKLDWIDISLDGMKGAHNCQRDSDGAWDMAVGGLQKAREVADEVNVPYTLTSINFNDLYAVADFVLRTGLADGVDFSTMSPVRSELVPYEITLEQMRIAWKGVKKATAQYPNRIFFRLYRHADMEKLICAVGQKKFWSILTGEFKGGDNHLVGVEVGKISFMIDGVLITYSPLSTWPPETFLIDADGRYGTAYSIGYTIKELRAGVSNTGEDLRGFTVAQLTAQSNFHELYRKCVRQWWGFRGKKYFKEEQEMFRRFRDGA